MALTGNLMTGQQAGLLTAQTGLTNRQATASMVDTKKKTAELEEWMSDTQKRMRAAKAQAETSTAELTDKDNRTAIEDPNREAAQLAATVQAMSESERATTTANIANTIDTAAVAAAGGEESWNAWRETNKDNPMASGYMDNEYGETLLEDIKKESDAMVNAGIDIRKKQAESDIQEAAQSRVQAQADKAAAERSQATTESRETQAGLDRAQDADQFNRELNFEGAQKSADRLQKMEIANMELQVTLATLDADAQAAVQEMIRGNKPAPEASKIGNYGEVSKQSLAVVASTLGLELTDEDDKAAADAVNGKIMLDAQRAITESYVYYDQQMAMGVHPAAAQRPLTPSQGIQAAQAKEIAAYNLADEQGVDYSPIRMYSFDQAKVVVERLEAQAEADGMPSPFGDMSLAAKYSLFATLWAAHDVNSRDPDSPYFGTTYNDYVEQQKTGTVPTKGGAVEVPAVGGEGDVTLNRIEAAGKRKTLPRESRETNRGLTLDKVIGTTLAKGVKSWGSTNEAILTAYAEFEEKTGSEPTELQKKAIRERMKKKIKKSN